MQRRYQLLVKQHLRQSESVATGLRVVSQNGSRGAADLGAWRFYDNPQVTLPVLVAPLLARAHNAVREACDRYALCVHDQSGLHLTKHHAKQDRKVMYSRDDLGYELQSALLLSDQDGQPLASAYLALAAKGGVYSTRREEPLPARPWVDEVNRTMGHLEGQQFDRRLVHIIDRELDKLLHLRRFVRCRRLFVIRANDTPRVRHKGESHLLAEVEVTLAKRFRRSREISYHGRPAWQYVAQTAVVLDQPARIYRQRNGKLEQRVIPGPPISLRLVIAQVRDKEGAVLATWRLWNNLPAEVTAPTIALWYYWRWRIESFHKLIKRAGQCIEQWQQTTITRFAKRLLVAAQACCIVWAFEQSETQEAAELKQLLLRLSGRQMRVGVQETTPALLAGFWNLQAIADVLDDYDVDTIRRFAQLIDKTVGLLVQAEPEV